MSFLRFMCGAGIYQLVKIKLWLLWRGKKMLEFNQSDCSGGSGGGFDSQGLRVFGGFSSSCGNGPGCNQTCQMEL